MKLVDNWRTWHRRWSVWIGSIGTILTTLLVALPDAARTAWTFLPDDLRAAVPPAYLPLIGVGLFVVSMLAQLVRQCSLNPPEPPS
jgi:hypothetical protein